MNELEEQFARELLAAPPWSKGAVLRSELGWIMAGAAKCVLDTARRRAVLWLRPADDLYRMQFIKALQHCGSTWAYQSLLIVREWDIPDLPDQSVEHIVQ